MLVLRGVQVATERRLAVGAHPGGLVEQVDVIEGVAVRRRDGRGDTLVQHVREPPAPRRRDEAPHGAARRAVGARHLRRVVHDDGTLEPSGEEGQRGRHLGERLGTHGGRAPRRLDGRAQVMQRLQHRHELVGEGAVEYRAVLRRIERADLAPELDRILRCERSARG